MIFLGLVTVLDFRGQDFVLACDSLSFDHRQKKASKEKGEPAGQALFTAMLGDLCRTRKAGTARSPRTLVQLALYWWSLILLPGMPPTFYLCSKVKR